ncbi:MAG: hypothetical protein WC969_12035 [Elusimicrobiota bacterium]|jgi:hypothetical protein
MTKILTLAALLAAAALPAAAVETDLALPQPAAFLQTAAQAEVPPIADAAPLKTADVATAQAPDFILPTFVKLFEDSRAIGVLGTKLTLKNLNEGVLGHLKTQFWDFERWTSSALGIVPRMDVELWSPDEKTCVAHADSDVVSYTYTVHVTAGCSMTHGPDLGYFQSDLWSELANSFSDVAKHELTKYASFFGIHDSEGKLIARSIKSQDQTGVIFYVQRAVYDESGDLTGYDIDHPVASISSSNGWNLQVLQPEFVQAGPGKMDPRLLVMIPGYKTFIGKAKQKQNKS